MKNERNGSAFVCGKGWKWCREFRGFLSGSYVSSWLSMGWWVDNADAKAKVEKPVGRDQPGEIIP